jgi:hypothetical protein
MSPEWTNYTVRLTDAQVDEVRALLPAGVLRRRRRSYRENVDYAATCVRMLRSMARRAAGDPDLLPALREISELVDELMGEAVAGCRREGYSWAEVAQRLGVTRQAAFKRYRQVDD